jgi:alpha-D-xyloside xylohydrolase
MLKEIIERIANFIVSSKIIRNLQLFSCEGKSAIRNFKFLLFLFTAILFSCQPAKFKLSKDRVEIKIDQSKLFIQVCTPSILHVYWLPEEKLVKQKSLVVMRSWPFVKWTLLEKKDTIFISTGQLIGCVNLKTGALRFSDSLNNTLLIATGKDSLSFQNAIVQGEKTFHSKQGFIIGSDEGLFGLGQYQDGLMNYRGKEILLAQANRTVTIPFLISTKKYGLLWDNYSEGWFKSKKNEMSFSSEVSDGIDYYFISGTSMDKVIGGYREATGTAPMFGKWAYGYWQSKEHYKTQHEVLEVAREFRTRQIPIDNIVQDWSYWGYDNKYFSGMLWDKTRYPQPKDMIDSLHQLYNLHFMCSIWPALGIGTEIFDELNSKGFIFSKVHWSSGRLYDAYNAEARDIYWKYLNKGLFSIGVDAFWMDGSEPEVTSTADPYITSSEIKALGKNSLGTFSRFLNPYSLVHTRGIYENQRIQTENKRVFILTRSAFAGQQRYAAVTWSGDIGSNWKILRNQISAGLNFCLAGIPYWTSDIGGFLLSSQGGMYPNGGNDPAFHELYVRWYQFGAFCPIFRSHGTNYPREPWQFGNKGSWAYDAIIKFDNLRYRLLPYIYSCAWMVTHEGYTIMRGLPFDFPNDPTSTSIDNQFMFGPSILVCPVTKEMYHKTSKQEDFIPASNLFNDKNEQGSLNLAFFRGSEFKIKLAETPMVEIALGWSGQIPDNMKNTDYTAVWTGKILSNKKGKYQFVITNNSSVKLWINSQLALNSTDTLQGRRVAEILLDSNSSYPIRLENYQFRSGTGNLKLEWIQPNEVLKKSSGNIECYLPPTKFWYDFWTGEKINGSQTVSRNTPIDLLPLFVKAGSVIPLGPFIQYASEKQADPLELRIYTGEDVSFNLYEDEGDSYHYEKGIYSIIPIRWDESQDKLTIGKREGEYPGMLKERTFKIIWVAKNHGIGVDTTSKPDAVIDYKGEEICIKRTGIIL